MNVSASTLPSCLPFRYACEDGTYNPHCELLLEYVEPLVSYNIRIEFPRTLAA